MTNNLTSILYKKYQDKQLASLYIASYDSSKVDPELWVSDFIAQFTKISDHPDILKIVKTDKETEYKVDSNSIRDFLKFINYRPLQLEKKFVFLFDAHDISLILSNKLLKVFEELGSDICLFLMVPDNAYMLPTVLSRAIKLQIQNTKSEVIPEINFENVQSPQDLLAFLKQSREGSNNSQIEKKFIEQTIKNLLAQSISPGATAQSFKQLDELLKILSDYEKYSNFNNSKLARMSRFFP